MEIALSRTHQHFPSNENKACLWPCLGIVIPTLYFFLFFEPEAIVFPPSLLLLLN